METRIVYRKESAVISASFSDNRLTSITVNGSDKELIPGDIFLGRIASVVPGIGGLFVNIGLEKNCFLKTDCADDPFVRQSHADGKLHEGDELLVQIIREEGRNKPATLSAKLSLSGVFVVVSSGPRGIRISSRITDEVEKKRLAKLADECLGDSAYEIMLRTNSSHADPEHVRNELRMLMETMQKMTTEGLMRTVGTKLYEGLPAYLCEFRDSKNPSPDRILVEDEDIYRKMKSFAAGFRPEYSASIRLSDRSVYPLEAEFDMRARISELTSRKVWLRSGAYLIFDTAEAMTVIDVNTGKASDSKTTQKGFLACNLEAGEEIARQLRLRNISGIIIVDFIDMASPEDRDTLMGRLRELMENDDIMTRVIDMTKLNLVEITRTKKKRPLAEDLRKFGIYQSTREKD